MKLSILLTSIFLIFESNAQQKSERIVAMKINRFEKCKDRRYPLFKIDNLTIYDNEKKDSTVSMNMTYLGGPYKTPKMPLEFHKCVYDGEQCELYLTAKPNYCEFVKDKHQVYTPYLEAFHPTPGCPLSGTYVVKNASFSFKYLRKLFGFKVPQIILDSYWKVVVRLFNDNHRLFGCYFFHVKMKEFRSQHGLQTGKIN